MVQASFKIEDELMQQLNITKTERECKYISKLFGAVYIRWSCDE